MKKYTLIYSIICLLLLTNCAAPIGNVGLTAKTYDNFTKDDVEKYNYVFDTNKISYKDKNGKNVVLTDEEKITIVKNVNQCLADAGYTNNNSKTKNIVLNLDFTEDEEKNKELYYDLELARRYKDYNYNIEANLGPKNRSISAFYFRQPGNTYAETLFNYINKDRIYFVSIPHYSKFAGLQCNKTVFGTVPDTIKVDECAERVLAERHNYGYTKEFHLGACSFGTTDVSNFYAKLSGKENNMTKFDVKLHYMTNLIKGEGGLKSMRKDVIDYISKNICMFIADNAQDVGVSVISSKMELYNIKNFVYYQHIKNSMNNAIGNYYIITNKQTGRKFNTLNPADETEMISELYTDQIDTMCTIVDNKYSHRLHGIRFGSKKYVDFYKMKYPVDQLEIKNYLVKNAEK